MNRGQYNSLVNAYKDRPDIISHVRKRMGYKDNTTPIDKQDKKEYKDLINQLACMEADKACQKENDIIMDSFFNVHETFEAWLYGKYYHDALITFANHINVTVEDLRKRIATPTNR